MSDARDYFFYSGPLLRGPDLDFLKFVEASQRAEALSLVLVTGGGSPDAAYKIGKYLQSRYKTFSIHVPGLCKSAGTLLAIAADEIVFSPYGELGPLDIQLAKTDNIAALESGLNISEAFATLEHYARQTFHQMVGEIVGSSGGVVSFQTASHSAAEIVGALYGPIYQRIDPEEVGSRQRSMEIGAQYGSRLNIRFQNLKDKALRNLAQNYPSHGFVIDQQEACHLFERVREATPSEKALVEHLGEEGRFPSQNAVFRDLMTLAAELDLVRADDEGTAEGDASFDANTGPVLGNVNGGDSAATKREQHSQASTFTSGMGERSQAGEAG